jgi:hypothetical protein
MASNYKFVSAHGVLYKVDMDGDPILETNQPYKMSVSAADYYHRGMPEANGSGSSAKSENTSSSHATQNGNPHQWAEDKSDEELQDQSETPNKPKLSKKELAKRDREAVAYSKALLVEGDTLVYITYPGEIKRFDPSGFEVMATPHRVHSAKLLATGSVKFREMFNPRKQNQLLQRKNLAGHLPPGVKYVLDLTPPDEGDDAVELLSDLSCSPGIRVWYLSQDLYGLPESLVGGLDEVVSRQFSTYGSPADGGPHTSQKPEPVTTSPEVGAYRPATWESDRRTTHTSQAMLDGAATHRGSRPGVDVLMKDCDVLEYCPVRHRAGIARLLQVLMGKDPRLDSAPKVWTLFVLAKYFDCVQVVVDWIVPWILEGLNTRFIEILPEVTWKMAYGMKNQLLSRAAFSVLVSEEAMSLASRELGKFKADQGNTNQLGRLKEDVDEDLRGRIEYASKSFFARVNATFDKLTHKDLAWFQTLPEFKKIMEFERETGLAMGGDRLTTKWADIIRDLVEGLKTYILAQIMATVRGGMPCNESNIASRVDGYWLYLDVKERIFTRALWKMLLNMGNSSFFQSEMYTPSNMDLWNLQMDFNRLVIVAIESGHFNKGVMPPDTQPGVPANLSSKGQGPEATVKNSARKSSDKSGNNGKWNLSSWNPFSSSSSTKAGSEFTDADGNALGWVGEWDDESESTPAVQHQKASDAATTPSLMDIDEFLIEQNVLEVMGATLQAANSNQSPTTAPTSLPSSAGMPLRMKDAFPTAIAGASASSSTQAKKRFVSSPNIAPTATADTGSQSGSHHIPRQSDGIDEAFSASSHESTTSPKRRKTATSPSQPQPTRPKIPSDYEITPSSPFFSATAFFAQVKTHMRAITFQMLQSADMPAEVAVTDTLLCLGPEEFKYLPLWAGGDDDGSGGVFDDAIPAAVAGPNGPGPAFHTGLSTTSVAGSEFDMMSERSAMTVSEVNMSEMVEDGFSDHLDRRLVIADDDFHSETFTEVSEAEVVDRKGKGVDRSGFLTDTPAAEIAPGAAGTVSAVLPDQESAGNVDFDMEDEEDDDDTTKGEGDDDGDQTFDSDEGEAFDFGDGMSDEEAELI